MQGSNFFIDIWQSPALVNQSCGVCVKWDCPLESPRSNPIAVIAKLCDAVIGAAQKNPIGTINRRVIKVAKISCINDVQTTFQAQVIWSFYVTSMDCFLFSLECSAGHWPGPPGWYRRSPWIANATEITLRESRRAQTKCTPSSHWSRKCSSERLMEQSVMPESNAWQHWVNDQVNQGRTDKEDLRHLFLSSTIIVNLRMTNLFPTLSSANTKKRIKFHKIQIPVRCLSLPESIRLAKHWKIRLIEMSCTQFTLFCHWGRSCKNLGIIMRISHFSMRSVTIKYPLFFLSLLLYEDHLNETGSSILKFRCLSILMP